MLYAICYMLYAICYMLYVCVYIYIERERDRRVTPRMLVVMMLCFAVVQLPAKYDDTTYNH